MRSTASILALVLSFGSNGIFASPYPRQACAVKSQRKAWESLTDAEKKAYIDADLCLMKAPPIAGVPGAQNVWDELQYTHAAQADYIHNVGAFLPFHRYYVTLHQTLLSTVCGYTGPLPYWNEPLNVGALDEASIFDTVVGFGGDGTGSSRCITDGPFVNTTLRIQEDLSTSEYCISRGLNDRSFNSAVQTNVDRCLNMATFTDAWNCIEASPHSAGHGGVNGVMVNVKLSPGDPVFYLHHGYIDKLWWDWEALKLPARLTEGTLSSLSLLVSSKANFARIIGGNNTARGKNDPAFVNYFGDNGSITTLNHVLSSHDLVPNATIADVMDIGGDYVCAEFV
ncbi:Di-copper centre-containing protein [Xylaria grammica]|nr:Di-copper centre-containing protein [Xylaria grammica]